MQAADAKLSDSKTPNAAMIACLCALCLGCIGAGYNRQKLRNMYEIQGNFFVDCLVHCFCGVCAVTQEWQHVMHVEYNDPKITICNKSSKK
jgi:Cys-rich protein (TIGR01571 family)